MGDFNYQQPYRFRITNRQREEEKKRKSGSSRGIPDRWLDYLGVNTWIEKTRFIAFKCPLKPELQKSLTDERRFTLGDLVERLDDKGKELGLIIDLTNTDRYYKPTDIADAQIEYKKMMTPGHDKIPSETCYQDFVNVVQNFLRNNRNNDKLIGVHCTHGLNRTGYLIVRYMIEHIGFEPNEALEAFNRARGHSMEKYQEDLLRRKPFSANTPLNSTLSTTPISTSSTLNNETTENEIQWPSLYGTVAKISLNGKPTSKQQRSQKLYSSISMDNYNNQNKEGAEEEEERQQQQFRSKSSASVCYRNNSLRSQNFNSSYYSQQNNFYRQLSVQPHLLNSSHNDDNQDFEQSATTYYGSGSSVGRGRSMKNDR